MLTLLACGGVLVATGLQHDMKTWHPTHLQMHHYLNKTRGDNPACNLPAAP